MPCSHANSNKKLLQLNMTSPNWTRLRGSLACVCPYIFSPTQTWLDCFHRSLSLAPLASEQMAFLPGQVPAHFSLLLSHPFKRRDESSRALNAPGSLFDRMSLDQFVCASIFSPEAETNEQLFGWSTFSPLLISSSSSIRTSKYLQRHKWPDGMVRIHITATLALVYSKCRRTSTLETAEAMVHSPQPIIL